MPKRMTKKEALQKYARAEVGGCLRWTGPIGAGGYGVASAEGRMWSAHRLAFDVAHGEIPAGRVVMHTCDNRWCIEPNHLVAGTQSDNLKDCFAKKRNSPRSLENLKLTSRRKAA